MGEVKEVEPCPFGQGPRHKVRLDTRRGRVGVASPSAWFRERVVCKCGAGGPEFKRPGLAVTAWNNRPASTGKGEGWGPDRDFVLRAARLTHSQDEGASYSDDPGDAEAVVDLLIAEARDLLALPVSPFKGGGTDLESTSQSSLRSSAPSFALPDAWRLAGRLLAYDGEFDTGYRFIRVGDDERPGWLRGATSTDLYENVTGAAPPTSTHAEEG